MRIAYKYSGCYGDRKGLVVCFEVGVAGSKRFEYVRVPWSELTERDILDRLGHAVAARLVAAWDEPPQDMLPWD